MHSQRNIKFHMKTYTGFCTLLDPKALNRMHLKDKGLGWPTFQKITHSFRLSDNQPHMIPTKLFFLGGGGHVVGEEQSIHMFRGSNLKERNHLEDLGQIGQ